MVRISVKTAFIALACILWLLAPAEAWRRRRRRRSPPPPPVVNPPVVPTLHQETQELARSMGALRADVEEILRIVDQEEDTSAYLIAELGPNVVDSLMCIQQDIEGLANKFGSTVYNLDRVLRKTSYVADAAVILTLLAVVLVCSKILDGTTSSLLKCLLKLILWASVFTAVVFFTTFFMQLLTGVEPSGGDLVITAIALVQFITVIWAIVRNRSQGN